MNGDFAGSVGTDSGGPQARVPLSVVVPTLNTRELTLRCLASVMRSAPPSAEVFVVDDGSTDGTAQAVAGSYAAVTILRHEQPKGFTAAANAGLARAKGDVLLLLNSDTEIEAGGLECVVGGFATRPRLGVAGGSLFNPDGSRQWVGSGEPSLTWMFMLTSGLPAALARFRTYRAVVPLAGTEGRPIAWVSGAALVVRAEVWREVGPFDDWYQLYAQDLDLCLRARERGWDIDVLQGFRVLHHQGATVGREADGPMIDGHNLELLWTDLLRWAVRRRGVAWATRAAAAMRWGLRLRLAARGLARPLVTRAKLAAWRRDTASLRRGLEVLGAGVPVPRAATEPVA